MRLRSALISSLVALSPALAAAQPVEKEDAVAAHPQAYSLRPLTLPAMTLAPEVDFSVTHFTVADTASADLYSWGFGASFGIIDDLTVELVPLSFYHQVVSVETAFGDFSSTDTDYHYLLAGATYRFLDGGSAGGVDLGARLRFAVDSEPNVYINPAFLLRLRHEVVRLDTGLEMMVLVREDDAVYSDSDVMFGLQGFGQWINTPRAGIPVELAFQIVDPFWLGLNTGFGIADFTADDVGDTVFVPLGWGAGGTIPYDDGQPMMDIGAGFGFPLFLIGGADEQPLEEYWQLGINATGFIYL